MSRHNQKGKNFQKVMKRLEFEFPGFSTLPRSPGTYNNLDGVDIHVAKRKLELLHRIPVFDPKFAQHHASDDYARRFMPELMAMGYASVANEIMELVEEEQLLLKRRRESGRSSSFLEDKSLFEQLIKGLISSFDAEKIGDIQDALKLRKELGENMITRADFWLARKMFSKCFGYLSPSEESDKARADIYCLLSYVCIYFEESQEIGFDLPTKCLSIALSLCDGKSWCMKKSVMNILIPKSINVYGLKNDWIKIEADWINMFELCNILMHILSVKKARYWQEQLNQGSCEIVDNNFVSEISSHLYANIVDSLTSALGYADRVRQIPAFLATTLRRGLFYEEYGDNGSAMDDFNALYALSKNFDDRESLAMTLNRIGHEQIRCKNTPLALDYFAQQLEIARGQNFPELVADAMQDLGSVLLLEGHTWEADECYNNAFTLFHDTKVSDTPNDLDEISWAMMGVSRGQHLWARYSALIRTQTKPNLKAVNQWKCTRKPLPLVKLSENIPQKRATFDSQYPTQDDDLDKRRLFEFPSEIQSKKSIWFKEHGYNNVFSYINVSEKPRVSPKFSTDSTLGEDDSTANLNLTRRRTIAAIEKAANMDKSLKKAIEMQRYSIFVKPFNETSPEEKDKQVKFNGSSDKAGIEEKLGTFLEKAEAALNGDEQNTDSLVGVDADDISDDTELNQLKNAG